MSGIASEGSIWGTCPLAPREPSRVVVDPDGDLCLRVGEPRCISPQEPKQNEQEPQATNAPDFNAEEHGGAHQKPKHEHAVVVVFVVCSKTLSRASRVWKSLLYAGFTESKQPCGNNGAAWTVDLPEDNPEALKTLLNIIHSRFEQLPKITDLISLEDLYQLTILTDKYDLTIVLRPWASTWLESINDSHDAWRSNQSTRDFSDLERRLWIAWELGDPQLFEGVAKYMVLYTCADASWNLQNNTRDKAAELFSSILEPPSLHDIVKEARLGLLEQILKPYRDAIECLLQHPETPGFQHICVKKPVSHQLDCEVTMLGVAIRSLSWKGYWPIPAASRISESVTVFASEFKELDLRSRMKEHRRCSAVPGIAEHIDMLLETKHIQLAESHRHHIESQAKKSGLAS
ncbi:Uu.00g120250.m01.CDS01 [Anthostomella pinea]|uniref:Uu.00g120250.m01.CDS01 n=1 Tax=Anthostomella pinea TaxID=933095 RepID=A0AAI8VHG4_9PEZI|nr:Uu.00g120250.m01.CDS01 [Anthostomella pinea]